MRGSVSPPYSLAQMGSRKLHKLNMAYDQYVVKPQYTCATPRMNFQVSNFEYFMETVHIVHLVRRLWCIWQHTTLLTLLNTVDMKWYAEKARTTRVKQKYRSRKNRNREKWYRVLILPTKQNIYPVHRERLWATATEVRAKWPCWIWWNRTLCTAFHNRQK